jgi:hypothetical protein
MEVPWSCAEGQPKLADRVTAAAPGEAAGCPSQARFCGDAIAPPRQLHQRPQRLSRLRFDRLYDVNERSLVEWQKSDRRMFDAARRIYDKVKTPGQPVFMMILTLNQHVRTT